MRSTITSDMFSFFSLQVGKGIPVDSSLAHVPRATDVEDEARCDEAHGRCLAKCRHQRKKDTSGFSTQRIAETDQGGLFMSF